MAKPSTVFETAPFNRSGTSPSPSAKITAKTINQTGEPLAKLPVFI